MAKVEKVPERYKASDGTAFDDPTQAELHEELIEARREVGDAESRLRRAIAAVHKTADGEEFRFRQHYWPISGNGHLPTIRRVRFGTAGNVCFTDSQRGLLVEAN